MKEVLPVYGVKCTREDGSAFFARHGTALAIWFDRKPAIAFANELKKHNIHCRVVKLKVTAEEVT